MKIKKLLEYAGALFAGTWIADYFMNYYTAYMLFVFLMVVDYLSGMLASYKEVIDNPGNSKYGWSSKKGIIGIFKKIGYLLTNVVALCIDYVLHEFSGEIGVEITRTTVIALVVLVWFMLNELLSITENAARMGAPIPKFLAAVLADLKSDIDSKDK
jgi:toxin secretion/phage lysis holin